MRYVKLTMCAATLTLIMIACNDGKGEAAKTDSVVATTVVPAGAESTADTLTTAAMKRDSLNAANTEAANAATEAEKKMDQEKK